MKVRETFWNTKIQLSFKFSSEATLIKKLSDGSTINFCGTSGHPLWIRANYRRFRQRAVEKKSPKTASFKVTKFLPCHLFATGLSNMYTVGPEVQFKVQTSLRKRNNFNRNWTKSWNCLEISEKIDEVWAKTFWQRCQNRNFHVQLFILRKVYFWGNYLISKISWILTKKTQFYAFRGFFREIFVSFPSNGKIKT